MAGQIDIIVAKQAQKEVDLLIASLKTTYDEIIKINQTAVNFNGQTAPKNPTQVKKATEELTAIEKQRLLVLKQLETTNARIAIANDRNTQSLNQQRTALRSVNSAYLQLSQAEQASARRLQDLIARGREATQTQRQYNNELKKAQKEFDVLRARILVADNATGRWNRTNERTIIGLRGIGTNLKSMLGAFGVYGGIMMFAVVMRDAFKVVKDFDKANADLAATMGVSRKQIADLTNDQKRLGATTKFTATEVAGLQKEFAKLGFNQKEILNATEATLNLAAAVDTDLANAAMVAGATLRGFGLDASEMNRVTDVMAMSFTKSALDISNFTESMKYVAPIAGQTGVSIEFTTAMLGKLADAGVKGSQAGTSLRRILTEMAKTGLPAAQAFDKVAKSGISVTDAMDEVGRTAQTALLVLSKSKDSVNDLADALDNAAGSAERMAKEQLESLSGKIVLMTSAWDGFILSLERGDGVISNVFKGLVSEITSTIEWWRKFNEATGSATEIFGKKTEEGFTQQLKQLQSEADKTGVSLQKLALIRQGFAVEERAKAKAEIKERQDRIKELNAMFDSDVAKSFARVPEKIDREKDAIKELTKSYGYYNGVIKATQYILKNNTTSLVTETEVTDVNTEVTKKATEEKKKKVASIKDVRFALIGTVEWFEKLRSALESEQKQVSQTSDKWQEYKAKIDAVQLSIDKIINAKKELEGIELDLSDDKNVTDSEGDRLREEGNKLRETLAEFKQSFIDDFADQSGFGKTLELLSGGLDKFEDDAISTALAVSEAFQEAFNTIASFSNANFEQMYTNLEQQRDVSILFAGESATAKEEIERQYEERRKKIQRQQAESQKRMAMFNIAMNTAQGIVSALAMLPPNIPLSIAIGAIGAVQLGLVASQPIPAFAEGGTHEGGLMLVNDAKGNGYKEKIVTPDGKVISPKGRNVVMNAPKGTQIFTENQWEKQLNSILLNNGINQTQNANNSNDTVVNVQTKDNYHFSIDEGGISKFITRGTTKTNILNSRFKIQGKDV